MGLSAIVAPSAALLPRAPSVVGGGHPRGGRGMTALVCPTSFRSSAFVGGGSGRLTLGAACRAREAAAAAVVAAPPLGTVCMARGNEEARADPQGKKASKPKAYKAPAKKQQTYKVRSSHAHQQRSRVVPRPSSPPAPNLRQILYTLFFPFCNNCNKSVCRRQLVRE